MRFKKLNEQHWIQSTNTIHIKFVFAIEMDSTNLDKIQRMHATMIQLSFIHTKIA